MATTRLDLVGSRFVEAIIPGGSYLRKARVDGLTPAAPLNMISEALTAPGMPAINSALDPALFNSMFLKTKTVTAVSCDPADGLGWASFDLNYVSVDSSFMGSGGGFPSDTGPTVSISGGAAAFEIEAYFDRFGNQLLTAFDNVTMGHRAIKFGTQESPAFRRLETTDPDGRLTQYVGKVNSVSWKGRAARTALCYSIDWDSNDGGLTYQVEYQFQTRAEGWDTELIHDDPFFPGHPIPNPITGTPGVPDGRVVYEAPDEIDFNALSL